MLLHGGGVHLCTRQHQLQHLLELFGRCPVVLDRNRVWRQASRSQTLREGVGGQGDSGSTLSFWQRKRANVQTCIINTWRTSQTLGTFSMRSSSALLSTTTSETDACRRMARSASSFRRCPLRCGMGGAGERRNASEKGSQSG